MPDTASELARRLARNAEAVCRHYLSNGRRHGRYWLVGDVTNTPGQSLYVRLSGPDFGKGAAGKWTDTATGEHGDMLDLIAASRRLTTPRAVFEEARSFLSIPPPMPDRPMPVSPGSPEAARRLFAMAQPILGTIAETYLRQRGISDLRDTTALRFHPCCYYRVDGADDTRPSEPRPALVAAVTALDDIVTGVQRTWLDPAGHGKASIATPRRAMGHLLGNAVRFGAALDVMAAGEGIETMLSLRTIMPVLPVVAALSANHLSALALPSTLRRLYIAGDNDPAGRRAAETLSDRAQAGGIEALTLTPTLDDFNDDLRQLGAHALAAAIRVQLAPEDVARFWMAERPIKASR